MSYVEIPGALKNNSPYADVFYSCQPNGDPWLSLTDVTDATFPIIYRKPGKYVFVQQGNKVLKYVLDMQLAWVLDTGAVSSTYQTNVTVGGIVSGTQILAGESLDTVIRKILVKVFVPTFTNPTFTLLHNAGGLRKIGEVITFQLQFNYYEGLIDNTLLNIPNKPRAGVATTFTFLTAFNGPFPNQPQNNKVHTVTNYTVLAGLNFFKAKVDYGQGPQPVDSSGANYDAPYPAGTSPEVETSFEGVYPLYATTSAIATLTEQALISMIYGNNIELTLVAESGGNKQRVAIPKIWINSRPLVAINYFNPISNSFDNTNVAADFAITSPQIGGVDYNIYTNTTSNRGTTKIRLTF